MLSVSIECMRRCFLNTSWRNLKFFSKICFLIYDSPSPRQPPFHSPLKFTILDFTLSWDHAVFVSLYLLILFSTRFMRFLHVVRNGRISFLSQVENVLLHMYIVYKNKFRWTFSCFRILVTVNDTCNWYLFEILI